MEFLKLEGIRKLYGDVVATERLDLSVHRGEFLVLVGPSGCGKTTILRIVAGLEAPSQGRIELDSRDITDVAPRDRDVAMVFQNYALYPHMSVRKNLSFGLRMRGVRRETIDRRVREVARALEIGDLLGRYPSQLSGGQRQRVALGRAIIREPKLFLMDEPLSNLDTELRVSMRAELLRLHARLGITTLYVTHDQVEAMTLGDRLVILRDGRVEQEGTPESVYRRPATLFVARFLGSPQINLLPARARFAADRCEVRIGSRSFPIARDRLSESRVGSNGGERELTVGIRPEAIELVENPDHSCLSGEVELIENVGKEKILFVRCESQSLEVIVPSGSPHSRGSRVHLDVPPEALHLFDPESGLALRTD